tara:strand:- start:26 stop:1444 length:1419 start_codon:yes stop_codon:yes gene_type:complete
MAEIYFSTQNEERADLYANKALDYNSYNLNARKIKLLLQSKNNRSNAFNVEYEELIKIDPLNHFALIESQFLSGRTPLIMPKEISNEFPDESILELVIYYKEMGLVSEAMEILKLSRTSNAKIHLWAAYLTQDMAAGPNNEYLAKAIAAPVDFVFPYRPETIAVLKWAISQNANWKFKYYLAQNYMAVGQKALGLQLLKDCGNEPDSDIFYRFRARMFENEDYVANEKDYLKALQINSSDWKLKEEVVQFYLDNNKIEQAYKLAKKSYAKYPNNANIGLIYAKSSLLNDQYGKTIEVLKDIMILPFEHASESKKIYTEAHMLMALDNMKAKNYKRAISFLEASKEWPENLGVGKPFHPDERLQDYLLAVNFEMLRDSKKSEALLTGILSYQNNNNQKVVSPNELFELLSLKKLGRSAELESAINRITNIKTSAMGELVLALYRNDTSAMQEIRNQNVLKNSSLKIMEAASKY